MQPYSDFRMRTGSGGCTLTDDHPSQVTPPLGILGIAAAFVDSGHSSPRQRNLSCPLIIVRNPESNYQELQVFLTMPTSLLMSLDQPPKMAHRPSETSTQCKSISNLWACNTLEKAHAFLKDIRTNNESYLTLENFISNTFIPQGSDNWVDSYEPKTGKLLARIPITSSDDIQIAVSTAKTAFSTWSKSSRAERSRYMQCIAALIQRNRELFAVWESIDQGKTLDRARIEVDRAVSNFSQVTAWQ